MTDRITIDPAVALREAHVRIQQQDNRILVLAQENQDLKKELTDLRALQERSNAVEQ